MTKALISVSGADTTGIIARIATKLYEMNINILDISQTILSGCFTYLLLHLSYGRVDFSRRILVLVVTHYL